MDVMGSTVHLGHLLNGHDGRLYPHGVRRLLDQVLAPCTMRGDSYRRQEAKVGRYHTMRSREYSGAFVPLNINHPCPQCMLFAGSCHCAAKHAMEKGPPTATCRKWHVGHGLVPRIAKQRNANECQRDVTWWEHRGRKRFLCRTHFFRTPPPPWGGHPRKKFPTQYQKIFSSPPCSAHPTASHHCLGQT